MSEWLEYTFDKFTFQVATDRYYSADGVWAKNENGHIRIGLSDFLQKISGDIAFADVVSAGTKLNFGDEVADIETIKVDVSLLSPVEGTVLEINPAMDTEPEVINQDPYGGGWLAVIASTDWPADQGRLLNPSAYFDHMAGQAEKETRT